MPAAQIVLPNLALFNKGLVTQRNPLSTPISQFATNIVQHHDALIDGMNVEVSSNNSLIRRWGLTAYSSGTLPASTSVDGWWSFVNTQGVRRNLLTTLGNTQALFQYTPTAINQIFIGGSFGDQNPWSVQGRGDYLYAMKGQPTATRWQPDHPDGGGQTVFNMGIVAPLQAPTKIQTPLPFNIVTSTPFVNGPVSGSIVITEPEYNIENYVIQINTDSTVQVSWTYPNYTPSAAVPFTDSSQVTPGGTAATVYVDPPNGTAYVTIKLTAASNNLDDIATILNNNTTLTVETYGLPVVTVGSVKGVTRTLATGRQLQLVLSPQADVVTSLDAGSAVILNTGTKDTGLFYRFPFIDTQDGALSGSFQLQQYVDGVASGAPISVSGTDYAAIATQINTLTGGSVIAGVEKDATEQQLYFLGQTPSGSLPAFNHQWGVINNTLTAGTGAGLTPTLDFVNNYAVRVLSQIQLGYVWKNPITGHVSNMSPPITIDPTDQGLSLFITCPKSTDPQATQVELYATADGGNTFALAPQFIAAQTTSTVTFGYFTPDKFLNEEIQAPLNLVNNPPPKNANGVVVHTDRLWCYVDNILYFSGGPDTRNGLGDEAWPPANNFSYPGNIVKLMPTPYGLLVFLQDDVHVVEGADTASYFSHLFAANFGIANPRAATLDAQTVYAYTTSRQLQAFGPGEQKEIGYDISPQFMSDFDPRETAVVLNRGINTDHALFISNGRTKMFRWTPAAQSQWSTEGDYSATTIGIIGSVTLAPGDIRLMVGKSQWLSGTNKIMFRDANAASDLSIPFPAFATIGSIQMTAPSLPLIASIDNIVLQTTQIGSLPSIFLALNELDPGNSTIWQQIGLTQQIIDPPTGRYPSTTLRQVRYYTKDSMVPITERAQNVFIKIVWPTEAAKNELLGLFASDKVQ